MLLKQLREDRGLSHEALSWAIYREGHGTVSGRNIRRIEDTGAIPTVRVRFALASYFGRAQSEIWQTGQRVAA